MRTLMVTLSTGVLLFSTSTTCLGQTSAGTFSGGGSLGYYYLSMKDGYFIDRTTTDLEVTPAVGYFIKDNFALGASLIMVVRTVEDATFKNRSTTYGFGLSASRYWFTRNPQFAFFGQGAVSFERIENAGNRWNAFIAPGLTWFPTPHWGVDLQVTLCRVSLASADGDNTTTDFELGQDLLSPALGIRYYF